MAAGVPSALPAPPLRPEIRHHLALLLDRDRVAVAVLRSRDGQADPAFGDAIFVDVGPLDALEADADPAGEQRLVVVRARRVVRQAVGRRVGDGGRGGGRDRSGGWRRRSWSAFGSGQARDSHSGGNRATIRRWPRISFVTSRRGPATRSPSCAASPRRAWRSEGDRQGADPQRGVGQGAGEGGFAQARQAALTLVLSVGSMLRLSGRAIVARFQRPPSPPQARCGQPSRTAACRTATAWPRGLQRGRSPSACRCSHGPSR